VSPPPAKVLTFEEVPVMAITEEVPVKVNPEVVAMFQMVAVEVEVLDHVPDPRVRVLVLLFELAKLKNVQSFPFPSRSPLLRVNAPAVINLSLRV